MGDPAGIGGEISLRAWQQRQDLPPFFIIDVPERLEALDPQTKIQSIDHVSEAIGVFPYALPVLPLHMDVPGSPGRPAPAAARATIAAIDKAVALAMDGMVSSVVTNPVNKAQLYEGAGFQHPGHTEYLADLAAVPRTVMMLVAPGLRVVPVTIHIALADVPNALSQELIIQTVEIVNRDLKKFFGLKAPRLALSALNPHAGEGGAMGNEEINTIEPAIRRLQACGIDVRGPFPADTMFHRSARAGYDVALCMYHDQALVPVKTLDFARGVNVTLGLPFVRTSPDHGTAYDIAGTGQADASSLIEAIKLAGQMAGLRVK